MSKTVEQMIQVVESNAVDNKAVIPDVESWAKAWREEASKMQHHEWTEVFMAWVKKESKFDATNFFDFLKANYEPPVKIS